MSPFLPPHCQYDFEPLYSPPRQISDDWEESAQSSPLFVQLSPIPRHQVISSGGEWAKDQDCQGRKGGVAATQSTQEHHTTLSKNVCQSERKQQRSLSLRKRGVVSTIEPQTSAKKQRKEEGDARARRTTMSKSPVNTVTPDRFSACIPCRRRKIKCIPKGDSHHYLANGTNNGVCATCVRRKKECFWPKIVFAASASPCPSEQKSCRQEEEEGEGRSNEGGIEVGDGRQGSKSDTSVSTIKEEEVALEKSTLPSIVGNYFGVSNHAFGRAVSTPGLISPTSSSSSSSSSSASSPLPVSPTTDVDSSSPICTDNFFIDVKASTSGLSTSTYLDSLQLQSDQMSLFLY